MSITTYFLIKLYELADKKRSIIITFLCHNSTGGHGCFVSSNAVLLDLSKWLLHFIQKSCMIQAILIIFKDS